MEGRRNASDPDDEVDLDALLDREARPDNEVPGLVALEVTLVDDSDVVVFISGMRAYRSGVEFTLDVRSRARDDDPDNALLDIEGGGPSSVLFGVEFADGRWCTNVGGSREGAEDQPVLGHEGGGADPRSADASFFLSPLPPRGDLRFAFAWPRRNIAETATTVSADAILEGARRSRELWPRESERDEEQWVPSLPDLTDTEWFAAHLGG